MRCHVVAGLFVLLLVSCKESDVPTVQPDKQDEMGHAEAKSSASATPAQDTVAPRPTVTVAAEPVPSSPFLVAPTPTQTTTTEALHQNPPPPPSTATQSSGNASSPTSNNNGKPCPVGQCQLDGKCVIPGGPIARPDAPPGAVSGACGGDGGPCSRCRCVSTGTLLSTPRGEIAIEDLRANDFVWSLHQGRVVAVPILATQKVRVQNHSMARMVLSDGFVLEISGEHPTGDGRNLWDLKPNEIMGQTKIESLSAVPYADPYTYDVLPDSDTGTYFVHGMWLGSTMFGQIVRGNISN